jgi:LAO/AO transport system kinase
VKDLIEKMLRGERRALARLLSYVEERDSRSHKLLEQIWPQTGRAISIGVTGPAGVGKSTLIDQLIRVIRDNQKKVGIIAVDPTSPFTGGAVLGDRVRMQRHSGDPDVFIRSIGSRGKTGGISFSTRALMQLLDAFGTDVILVETVGAGQSEVNIVDLVDTTVVVLMPEAGDSIQALKAGLFEIADVFVVNKKDRDGAERVAQDVETMLSLAPGRSSWKPPIVLTEATNGDGVGVLWKEILRHHEDVVKQGIPKKELLRRRLHELSEIVGNRLSFILMSKIERDSRLMKKLEVVSRPNLYSVCDELLKKYLKSK